MPKIARFILTAAITAASAWAQTQIATVTSASPFTLRGESMAVGQGVPDFPVLDGDLIKAGTKAATVLLPDRSTLALAPGSEARMTVSGGKVVFQILSGSVRYSLKAKDAVVLMAGGHTIVPAALAGVLSSDGSQAAAAAATVGWWTAGHTVAVVAVGAAVAGTVGGVAATVNSGTPVSPSR